jgi:hypothetical protein
MIMMIMIMIRSVGILALCGCGLQDAEANALAQMLSDNAALRELDLADNALTDVGVAALAVVLKGANSSVRLLKLKGNAAVTVAATAALEPLLLRNSLAGVIATQLPEVKYEYELIIALILIINTWTRRLPPAPCCPCQSWQKAAKPGALPGIMMMIVMMIMIMMIMI